MVYWFGKELRQLDRNQLEELASLSIVELISARHVKAQREKQDTIIITFASGMIFALIAAFVGIGLH